MLLLLLGACHTRGTAPVLARAAAPDAAGIDSVTYHTTVEVTVVEVDEVDRTAPSQPDAVAVGLDEVARVTPRIATLRAVPERVELRMGERLRFDALRVTALDSAGAVLATLPVFDAGMDPGAAALDEEGGVTAHHPGESELRVWVSMYTQNGGRGDSPAATVRIVVRP